MVLKVNQDDERDARSSERAALKAEHWTRDMSLHRLPEAIVDVAKFWGGVRWWQR